MEYVTIRGAPDLPQVHWPDPLQAQLNLFTSQDQLAQSRGYIGLDLVALYKALGGGWNISVPPRSSAVASSS